VPIGVLAFMRLKTVMLALFVAGLSASLAIAGPPAGKGKNKGATTTTTGSTSTTGSTTTTTTETGAKHQKVTLCHATGSKQHAYVKITIAASAVAAHMKKGDVSPGADGSCPTAAPTTTTTATTTTTPA
jgi:hypothetical protein